MDRILSSQLSAITEVSPNMPTAIIVIFLLFFAVLAFGWFYLQRAKTRDVVTTDTAPRSTTVTTADTAPEAPARPVDPAP
jgi:hypothetical protein